MATNNPIALPGLTTREAIADALYRCVIGLDSNDQQLIESAWDTSNAFFQIDDIKMEGWQAINDNMIKTIGPMDTQHSISNIRVDVKDGANTAYMTAYSVAQHYRPGEGNKPDAPHLLAGSKYFIDVVKDASDGLWKVQNWRMNVIWRDGDNSVLGG